MGCLGCIIDDLILSALFEIERDDEEDYSTSELLQVFREGE